ncbi:uncharacterized protein WM277_007469 isoform 2-T2 [Molossus nigricans]
MASMDLTKGTWLCEERTSKRWAVSGGQVKDELPWICIPGQLLQASRANPYVPSLQQSMPLTDLMASLLRKTSSQQQPCVIGFPLQSGETEAWRVKCLSHITQGHRPGATCSEAALRRHKVDVNSGDS